LKNDAAHDEKGCGAGRSSANAYLQSQPPAEETQRQPDSRSRRPAFNGSSMKLIMQALSEKKTFRENWPTEENDR